MAYRRAEFAPGECYHLYNRGNNKQEVFHNEGDYARFLFYLLYCQSPLTFSNPSEKVTCFALRGEFGVTLDVCNFVTSKREVALMEFCLMPNHFHIIVEEIVEGGISRYMQRALNGYTKYANKKYSERHVGHVFQGPFKAVHQETDEQLLYLSAYIHRNPRELVGWTNKEKGYPWSSFQDFIGSNRWGKLILPTTILEQFKNREDYEKFVHASAAKNKYAKFLQDNEILFEAGLEQEDDEVIV